MTGLRIICKSYYGIYIVFVCSDMTYCLWTARNTLLVFIFSVKALFNLFSSSERGSLLSRLLIMEGIRGYCSKRAWKKRFPISIWLPQYCCSYIPRDVIAGLTVALTVIPQSLAYASIAKLHIQVRLCEITNGICISKLSWLHSDHIVSNPWTVVAPEFRFGGGAGRGQANSLVGKHL